MDFKRNIIITGGAGFIGSHVVRLFVNQYPDYHIINLDKLTYAGNLANLKDVENKPNYTFVKADICDFEMMLKQYAKQVDPESALDAIEAGTKEFVNDLLKLPKPRSAVRKPGYTHLIDTFAMEPYRIIPIPGGINGVIIAEVAVRTDENSFEYPAFSISGTSIFASIAASARLLPESPPIKVDNSTLTCPRPPVILLVSALQKFIILFVTPV